MPERGLSAAKKASEALYSENIQALGTLEPSEVKKLFQSSSSSIASFSEVYLEPGTSVLDMAMKAKCFNSEGITLLLFA